MNLSILQANIEPLDLRSCLISINGQLIFQHYRDRHIAAEVAKINSCTKSVLSALLCIAMDKQLIPEPSTLASVLFPRACSRWRFTQRNHYAGASADDVCGLQLDGVWRPELLPRMIRTSDWLRFTLEQPLSDEPGTRMEYNSGVSQLALLYPRSSQWNTVAQFAQRELFEPLGIKDYEWETDPQGIHTGGFGLRLIPSDMLKLGQLYLQQGQWKSQELIRPDLVERTVFPAFSAGAPRRGKYGWHWWADSFYADEEQTSSIDYFYALGFGGQQIIVIPRLEVVTVITNDKLKKGKPPADVFTSFIIPLLRNLPVVQEPF